MEIQMKIREKFELPGGITILACAAYDPKCNVIGKTFSLVLGEEVRQTLTISGERKMANQMSNLDQRAFETSDVVSLSQEEARSGEWQLIGA
jgi:hypothetical protein